MFRKILTAGLIAGVIASIPYLALIAGFDDKLLEKYGYLIGYTTMLIALSAVFVAVKRRRDNDLGGVISFLQAFLMGLAISLVASVIYALSWELVQAVAHMNFAEDYANGQIAHAKAKGVHGAALQKIISDMNAWKVEYASPFYRLTETFTEIFPVGVLVSLISAGLLRNRRFLPARRS
jgi:Protein of unknown function (DUF4199)